MSETPIFDRLLAEYGLVRAADLLPLGHIAPAGRLLAEDEVDWEVTA